MLMFLKRVSAADTNNLLRRISTLLTTKHLQWNERQASSSVLGCEGEELHTAVFKHHLRQLLQRATGAAEERSPAQSQRRLTLASVMVVDTPGFRNPRHSSEERAAGWSELCHNYLQERLLEHYHTHTFKHTLERYTQEKIPVEFECPESSPAEVVSALDQPPPQVLQDGVVKAMFTPRGLCPPCVEVWGVWRAAASARCRGTAPSGKPSAGMAAVRRHSQCIAVKLQADALVNLIRRARPVFLQCVNAKMDGGGFDVPALRVQLHSTQILSALQLYRTGGRVLQDTRQTPVVMWFHMSLRIN
ncbi:hypothetical protein INR49_010745 [Caranx melampygus]|nr:hypothetical protein INR49_010745 [Caranx melampygus]